jgi:methionyl-tRNA synthetase
MSTDRRDRDTFYITTPIYYPNGEPHLGHAYTTIAADAVARYHRLRGDDTYLLTGTDEHGIKMVKTAQAANTEPAALADQNVAVFQQVWKELEITHDDFIRTTQPRHKQAVQRIVERLLANDDIYLGSYEGWYDEGQEEFVAENAAKEQEYKSAVSGRPLVRYAEKSYFFRLSKYAPRILEYIREHPEFVQPQIRRNEVVSKLEQGVGDLSISRATLKWGIPMPNDPEHVVYVWIDALSNYITALGYASDDEALFRRYWPGVHLIGKEILWFHAVYWPAMLFSLGLPLPKRVFAHGWWTSGGKKMSKTMGNFIGLEKLRAIGRAYGYDALRYYLLRAAPFGSDLDWTDADFAKSVNEQADVVGNLLNRVLKMINSYREGVLPAPGTADPATDDALAARIASLPGESEAAYARFDLQQAVLLPVETARAANVYIDATKPFSLRKDPANAGRVDTILNLSAQAVYRALVTLLPIIPEKAAAGLAQLGVNVRGRSLPDLFAGPLPAGPKLSEGQPLFKKVEVEAKK